MKLLFFLWGVIMFKKILKHFLSIGTLMFFCGGLVLIGIAFLFAGFPKIANVFGLLSMFYLFISLPAIAIKYSIDIMKDLIRLFRKWKECKEQ